MPPLMERLHGEDLADFLEPTGPLATLATQLGVTLTRPERPEGMHAAGWFRPKTRELVVYTDAPGNDQAATLVHELAHAILAIEHHDHAAGLTYAAEELVVESVAYSVCQTLGLDTSTATVPYLASWATSAPTETIEQHAKLVDQAARRIEEHVLTALADADKAGGEQLGEQPRPRASRNGLPLLAGARGG